MQQDSLLLTSEDKIPTVEEMYRAQQVFLKGHAYHYSRLDPRITLFGMQDAPNDHLHILRAYGHDLVATPGPFKQIFDSLKTVLFWVVLGRALYNLFTYIT